MSAISGCGNTATAPLAGDDAISAATSVIGGPANDANDCCFAAQLPFNRLGCELPDVESCVCDLRPACCTQNWDLSCVGIAANECDGCPDLTEGERDFTSLLVDSDGDGLLDLDEIIAALNPHDPTDGPDIDGDGIPNSEDPDVDGDGIDNAYDRDIDGDGIENSEEDDPDADGRDNDEDNDDDGDGVPDSRDSDDDGDGFPDPPDDDGDEDDDGKDDEACEKNKDCNQSKGEVCAGGECVTAAEAANSGPLSEVKCSADGDCEGNEVCLVVLGDIGTRPEKLCMDVDPICGPGEDQDRDGVCDKYDRDLEGNGDDDNDNDGINDRDEGQLMTDPGNPDTDRDFVDDGSDTAPTNSEIALPDTTTPDGEDDEGEGEDDEEGEGCEGDPAMPETGETDTTEGEDGAENPEGSGEGEDDAANEDNEGEEDEQDEGEG